MTATALLRLPTASESIEPASAAAIQKAVTTTLDANPHCGLGLLERYRVVIAEHGVMSHDGAKELFAYVSSVYWYWYGHVLKLRPREGVETDDPWAAVLLLSHRPIDGDTVEGVLESARSLLTVERSFEPGLWAEDLEDVFARRPTFEDACEALARMIRRFDPALRLATELDRNPPGKFHLGFCGLWGCAPDECEDR